jgi:hypothetical protein
MTFLGVACFGLRMLESVALMNFVNFFSSCAAASIAFLAARSSDRRVRAPLAIADLAGDRAGAHLAAKGGERLVRGLIPATVAGLATMLLPYDVVYRAPLAST